MQHSATLASMLPSGGGSWHGRALEFVQQAVWATQHPWQRIWQVCTLLLSCQLTRKNKVSSALATARLVQKT